MSNIICDPGRPGWPKAPTSNELWDWVVLHSNDLTDRQLTILEMMAQGRTSAEIAQTLEISTRTVTALMMTIFDRLEALTPSNTAV
ncbi:MAG: response regulator transcription factor [Thermomicrobiales bacterium]